MVDNISTEFKEDILRGSGPGSVVSIATADRLDGPGIESRWGQDFPHLSRSALRPTQSPVQWVPGLSRGKVLPERDADPSSPSRVYFVYHFIEWKSLNYLKELSVTKRKGKFLLTYPNLYKGYKF